MDAAARRPVTLPVPNPTKSYWQDPPLPLAHHRTTADLPPTTDYAIIGSGISGASIAHYLQRRQPGAQILLLEARTAASGATGRNGGHTKAASYRTWGTETRARGRAEADRIARLEAANVRAQAALAASLGIDCDLRASRTVDVVYDAAQLRDVAAAARTMNEAVAGDVERYEVVDAGVARAAWLCPDALGAVEYDAGSMSAYKLAHGLLDAAVARGLNLQTETPVAALEAPAAADDAPWTLRTPRGPVAARKVILATNGYTAALVPALQGTIVPLRGQMSVQRPGTGLPRPLPGTYTFSYAAGYEYMITRPAGASGAGDVCIGGGWATLPDEGAGEFGETDDGTVSPAVSAYLADSAARYFGPANWGDDDAAGRVKAEWTGIMGTSADGLPYVGRVPGADGLWMSVSFNGHGMALALKCAEALVIMMEGDDEEQAALDGWFPRSFRLSSERIGVKFEGRRNQTALDELAVPVKPTEALEERKQMLE